MIEQSLCIVSCCLSTIISSHIYISDYSTGLAIGKNEVEEGTEVSDGLVGVALQLLLIVERGGTLSSVRALSLRLSERGGEVRTARIPEEVLEELVAVLGGNDITGRVDDIADVLDETLAFRGECGSVDGRVVMCIAEGFVDLAVVWKTALTESLDGTVQAKLTHHQQKKNERVALATHLPVDVCILLLLVDGVSDCASSWFL